MYAVQSLKRLPEEEQQHVTLEEDAKEPDVNEGALFERMNRPIANTLPKNMITRTPVQVYLYGR
jgi:hypothetical protein